MAITAQRHRSDDAGIWTNDPPPTTSFEVVAESGLLRLRYYGSGNAPNGFPPVLLVYPLIKRPYMLDLLPGRSVVRNLLRQGFKVYMTDWLPPGLRDAGRGFDEYVNEDLADTIDFIREREAADRVSLVACCCAGLLCLAYTAFDPEAVEALVSFAAPLAVSPLMGAAAADLIVSAYGNVPAWMMASALNARMQNPYDLPSQLARDFGEPELALRSWDEPAPVVSAVRHWLNSDVPLAGKIFLEVVRDALPDSRLLRSRFSVGGRRVELDRITCPVLAIAGAHDAIVPPASVARLVERLGSSDARTLVFPTGHLGLMASLAAQRSLWPAVGEWLRSHRLSGQAQCA
jgi:polyhydroxyalkanoate synthase